MTGLLTGTVTRAWSESPACPALRADVATFETRPMPRPGQRLDGPVVRSGSGPANPAPEVRA